MTWTLNDLRTSPNPLASHYARFRVQQRLLLTGHSHRAWPDRAREGQIQAWDDAAGAVDDKWERAFEKADGVRRGYARLLDATPESIALGANTHELVVRFLSALPLRDRPRLVTTTGEFHAIRRQLQRLEEEGLEVHRVPVEPVDGLPKRVSDAVDDRTASVLVSSVLFENARIVPGLGEMAEACRRHGARFLVDAYHHLNVVPFSIRELGLEDAFVVGGGYKYCQLGEGNAFLRFPPESRLRPAVTGWFAEFGAVVRGEGSEERDASRGAAPSPRVVYGPGPTRFAGATYDPTSHYRGAEVFSFLQEMELTPSFLREVSRHQVGLLARTFDALDPDPALIARDRTQPLEETAGFLSLRTSDAGTLESLLRKEGIHVDHRGDLLRLGPAPYLSDGQIQQALEGLGQALQQLPG